MNEFMKKLLQAAIDGKIPFVNQERAVLTEEDKSCSGPGPFAGIPAEERAGKLLAAMSPEEKLAFVGGDLSFAVRGIPRLGLPRVWTSDATGGIRGHGTSTSFPCMLALAATWNRETVRETARTIAHEGRAKGISILLGPGVNIYRIPVCGRNFEYAGEDPFLTGSLASAYIAGAREGGMLTTIKHFACNNSEYDRHKINSELNERTLREIYLRAFEIAVKGGKATGVMSSYNPVNGVYASANRHLLTEILREEWGFDGFVMSDWNSLYDSEGPVKSGLDIEMPFGKWLSPRNLKPLLDSARITWREIDAMILRLLRVFFREGIYDRPTIDPGKPEYGAEHTRAALRAAREGIVLLRNEGALLPLFSFGAKSGPAAAGTTAGGAEAGAAEAARAGKDTAPEAGGSSSRTTVIVIGEQALKTETGGGGSSHLIEISGAVSILDGMRACAPAGVDIVYLSARKNRLSAAERRAAEGAAAVVCCVGYSHYDESESYDREWELPRNQAGLIRECAAANPNTVVVLVGGGGVETASWLPRVPAFLHTFFLGQTVGQAVGEVIFGAVNPSGKLPITMERELADIPAMRDYPRDFARVSLRRVAIGQGNPKCRKTWTMQYAEGLMVGYRHFTTTRTAPLYPFGFGLSYTTFTLEGIALSSPALKAGGRLEITLTVRNTGAMAGAETVQLYIREEKPVVTRPERELKNFEKIFLRPGESRKLTLRITPEDLAFWDPAAGRWRAEPGEFTALVGTSSADISAELEFEYTGA